MSSARVISVNTGRGRDAEWAGGLRRTAIDKRPASCPLPVGRLGLAGDEQVDKPAHGGVDQAVYVYAREDLDWWASQLGRDLPDGIFGENVTTSGLEVTGALIGEVWRLGTALVQVATVRIPCVVFQNWMGEEHWVKRFADAGRPGAMLRVLEEGVVGAGDPVDVLSRPAERVTVAEAMRAYYGDAWLMRRLLRVEGRGAKWDEIARSVLRRAAPPVTPAVSGEAPAAGAVTPAAGGGAPAGSAGEPVPSA